MSSVGVIEEILSSRDEIMEGIDEIHDLSPSKAKEEMAKQMAKYHLEFFALFDMVYRADCEAINGFVADTVYLDNEYGNPAAVNYFDDVIEEIYKLELIIDETDELTYPLIDFLVSGAIGAEQIFDSFRASRDIYGHIFGKRLDKVVFALPSENEDRFEQIKYGYSLLKDFDPKKKELRALDEIIQRCPKDLRLVFLHRVLDEPNALPLYTRLVRHGLRAEPFVQFMLSESDIVMPDEAKSVIARPKEEIPEQITTLNFLDRLSNLGGPFGPIAAKLMNIPLWYEDATLIPFLCEAPINLLDKYIIYLERGESNKRQILYKLIAPKEWTDRKLQSVISNMDKLEDEVLEPLVSETNVDTIVSRIKGYAAQHERQAERRVRSSKPKVLALDKREALLRLVGERYGFKNQEDIEVAYDLLEKHGLENRLLSVARTRSREGMDRFLAYVDMFVSTDSVNSNFAFLLNNREIYSAYIEQIQDKNFDDDKIMTVMEQDHSNQYKVFGSILSVPEEKISYSSAYIERDVKKVQGETVYIFGGEYSEERKWDIVSGINGSLGVQVEIYDFDRIDNVGLKEYTPDVGDVIIWTTRANKHRVYYQMKAICSEYDIPFLHSKEDGTERLVELAEQRITSIK